MEVNNEKTVLALKEASTEISNFVGSVIKEVETIESKYGDVVPMAETKNDYDFCKSVRKDVQPIKVKMEEARKILKAPVLEMGKTIDSSLKPLVARLEEVYKPFVNAYQEVDNRKKRAEEERKQKIQQSFDRLNDSAMEAIGQSSIVIESIIEEIASFDFDPDVFQERTNEAVEKHSELMTKLSSMKEAQVAAEDLQRRQAEIEEKELQHRLEMEQQERAKRELEIAENAKKEAEKRHKEEMEQQKAESERLAELAAKNERERIERDAAQKIEEEKRREADKKHKANIHNEILAAITSTGITEAQGKAVIKLIATGKAGNVRIYY